MFSIFLQSLKSNKVIFAIGFALFFSFNSKGQPNLAFANKKKTLEAKRLELLKEIDFTRRQLNDVRKQKTINLNQLNALKAQIDSREKMIKNINNELEVLSNEISETQVVVGSLAADLTKYRKEYAIMLEEAYKNRETDNMLLFVLSSKDFNQAWMRLRYLQQYKSFRKHQVELIQQTQTVLNTKLTYLNERVKEKQLLKGEEESQKNSLKVETIKKDNYVKQLQKDEKQLTKALKEKKAISNNLNRAIEDIIRKEILQAEMAAKKAPKAKVKDIQPDNVKPIVSEPAPKVTSTKAEALFSATPEAKALGNNFLQSKGLLPWPVGRGYISEPFGDHPHPVLKNVRVKNNGVDIRTQENETVQALFKGEVSGIIAIPGMQKVVLIRHGQYLSVYAHLGNVQVEKGQKVDAKTPIGTAYTNTADGVTEVHLELWKGTTKLDPQQWLIAK